MLLRGRGGRMGRIGRIVAVGQFCLVLRDHRNCLFIDGSRISNCDGIANSAILDKNGHLERIRSGFSIIGDRALVGVSGHISTSNLYRKAVPVKGQSLAHGIGDFVSIGFKSHGIGYLAGNGVVDRLAHIGANLIIGLLKGHVVLIVDGDSRVGGGQVAQCAGGTGDEVVAQVEVGNRDRVSVSGQLQSGHTIDSRLQRHGKVGRAEAVAGSNDISITTVDLGQRQAMRPCSIGTDSVEPFAGAVNGVRIVFLSRIIDHIKNLVGFVLLICNGIRNGNGAGGGGGYCFRGKGCGGQGEDHDQCQQETGEFSCAFHFLCSFFHRNFELEWWLSAYQEDASSSFRRLQWLYNRVAAPKISARPPAV